MAGKFKIRHCAGCGKEESVSVTNVSLRCIPCGRAVSDASRRRRVERTCETCGSGFSVARSVLSGKTNSSARFCSRPCYEQHLCRTERISGRGSQWRRIRAEAIRRAPFCACCGTSRWLQVHHAIPFRLTRDNSQENLFPLCVKHHKAVESLFVDVEGSGVPLEDAKTAWTIMLRQWQGATRARLLEIWRGQHAAA